TDVIPLMRRGDVEAEALVDVSRLPDMNSIRVEGETICLGALATHGQVCSSPLIREKAALLCEASAAIGSPQIRNVATVGGNIVSGQPAADAALPLLALDAIATVLSKAGTKEIPLKDFFQGHGRTAVDPRREILTQIRFRGLGKNRGGSFLRLSPRKSLSLPILAVAAILDIEPEKKSIREAAIAIGPVAPVPFRARRAEAGLRGAPLNRMSLERAARDAFEESNPRTSLLRGSTEYRKEMVKVLTARALKSAAARAGLKVEEG
ncbi:MAG TPA: FAD binding domain-containing protein, partial [Thermodesulfobacteriota bacterium]|nr:FAD binding domain-containing protein [Thermodesulfobacteriota bacterium]